MAREQTTVGAGIAAQPQQWTFRRFGQDHLLALPKAESCTKPISRGIFGPSEIDDGLTCRPPASATSIRMRSSAPSGSAMPPRLWHDPLGHARGAAPWRQRARYPPGQRSSAPLGVLQRYHLRQRRRQCLLNQLAHRSSEPHVRFQPTCLRPE